MTDTELKLIAAAAIIGLSSTPKNGYSAARAAEVVGLALVSDGGRSGALRHGHAADGIDRHDVRILGRRTSTFVEPAS